MTLIPTFLQALSTICFAAQENAAQENTVVRSDEVVAGSPDDFMEVRHVVLAGSNLEIGRALAKLAKERFGAVPPASKDPARTRAQRRFIEKQFPALHERMRGAAEVFGVSLDDDKFDLNGIADPYLKPSCSVVFFPPSYTDQGVGVMSRNYDYSTGTLMGTRPEVGHRPATSRPMVLELHPEGGHASLSLCVYDVFGGVIDGINSAGLTVALLAVDEQFVTNAVEMEGPPQVGFGVLATLRLLLDTCATVEEAKEALFTTKQVYEVIPCHFIVADAHGKSFVWERSFGGNFDYVFDGNAKPQIITNYAIYKHPELANLPVEPSPLGAFSRARRLATEIAAQTDKLSLEEIKNINECVAVVPALLPMSRRGTTNRTLWHALYVPEERRMEIDFYLRDEPDSQAPGGSSLVRSGYLEFVLEKDD